MFLNTDITKLENVIQNIKCSLKISSRRMSDADCCHNEMDIHWEGER